MKVLGIRYGHSAGAALIIDGEIVANVMEERFTRIKNDGSFPENAIRFCLKQGGISSEELDVIALPNKELPNEMISFFPRDEYAIHYADPSRNKVFEKKNSSDYDSFYSKRLAVYIQTWETKDSCEFWCIDHHLGHAASAYYTSGLDEETLIFTLDGIGDKVSGTISTGKNGKIERFKTFDESASLGWFYSVVTEALDWRHGTDEWKVMGLAPYASPKIGILDGFYPEFYDGELKKGFNFGDVYRWPDHGTNHYHFLAALEVKKIVEREGRELVAAEAQRIVEEQLFNIVLPHIKKTGIKKCCFAGGLFLNVKANQQLWYSGELDEQWVYPDPGDSGLPIGVALYSYHSKTGNPSKRLKVLYHGPEFSNDQVKEVLDDRGIDYEFHENIEAVTASYLEKNYIIGWFQGKMEAGPRALGNRSILMSPTQPDNKDIINEKVKFREPFRPFCPSMLEEVASKYLINPRSEYFMISSFAVKEGVEKEIPAVVHVDNTARPQFVTAERNERYYKLIQEFGKRSGHSVLLNTSFNVKGEPIVCNPREAIRCFYDTGLDVLVIGNYLIKKKNV